MPRTYGGRMCHSLEGCRGLPDGMWCSHVAAQAAIVCDHAPLHGCGVLPLVFAAQCPETLVGSASARLVWVVIAFASHFR